MHIDRGGKAAWRRGYGTAAGRTALTPGAPASNPPHGGGHIDRKGKTYLLSIPAPHNMVPVLVFFEWDAFILLS